MQQLLTILHILAAIFLIGLVLIQKGNGASMGAGFGAGASQTMFGSEGATPFLVKLTGMLAFVFFITCGALSFFISKEAPTSDNFVDTIPVVEQPVQSEPLIPTTQPLAPVEQPASDPVAPSSNEQEQKPLQSLIPQPMPAADLAENANS
jgi:preprotein translocase subunit SecG